MTASSVSTKIIHTIGAIILKYFVIIDILINFFGKINVELSPRLNSLKTTLEKAEISTFGSIETTSPIKDGGEEVAEEYKKLLEDKR